MTERTSSDVEIEGNYSSILVHRKLRANTFELRGSSLIQACEGLKSGQSWSCLLCYHVLGDFMPKARGLTPKQLLFVQRYLVHLNATKAAKEAKYKGSATTLAQVGAENLRKPQISAEIEKGIKEVSERNKVNQDWVIKRLMSVADGRLDQFASWTNDKGVKLKGSRKLDKKCLAALAGIKTTKKCAGFETDYDEDGNKTKTAIYDFSTEIKLRDNVKALEQLGDHLGLFDGNKDQPDHGVDREAHSQKLLDRVRKLSK